MITGRIHVTGMFIGVLKRCTTLVEGRCSALPGLCVSGVVGAAVTCSTSQASSSSTIMQTYHKRLLKSIQVHILLNP